MVPVKCRSKAMLLTTIILIDLLTGMEFDLFVPSLSQVQRHFHLSPFWVEALVSSNFLGYCISLFFVGGLSDRYGRKPVIILGLITFVIGSLISLQTISYPLMLLGRFLQGLGIAAPAILSFLIIADLYDLKEQEFLMAMLNGLMNTSVAIAPILGSYIALYFHWRGNFVALLLLGMIVTLMSQLFIPFYVPPKESDSVVPGYMAILRSRPLLLLIISLFLIFIPYWIFVGISPLLYVKDMGVSLSHFGLYQGSLALVFALGSFLFGFFLKHPHYSRREMLLFANGILILSLALILFPSFSNSSNPLIITLTFMPFIIGQVIPSTLIYPLCLGYMPGAKGRIAALIQAGRLIFAAIGVQIVGYFYDKSFRSVGLIIAFSILLAVLFLYRVTSSKTLQKILR